MSSKPYTFIWECYTFHNFTITWYLYVVRFSINAFYWVIKAWNLSWVRVVCVFIKNLYHLSNIMCQLSHIVIHPLILLFYNFCTLWNLHHSKACYCCHEHNIFVQKPLEFAIACVFKNKFPIIILLQWSLASLYCTFIWYGWCTYKHLEYVSKPYANFALLKYWYGLWRKN